MIVQLKIDDDLYAKYAKRNPKDPRKALEEALSTFQDVEIGVPRLTLENPELKELKTVAGEPIGSSADLVAWAKRHSNVSVAGVEVPLSVAQRQRLAALAPFFQEDLGTHIKRVVGNLLVREIGA